MPVPNNILQTVETYAMASLAYLVNSNCFIGTANTQFDDFERTYPANLGQTITFTKPFRMTASDGLVASLQGIEERKQSLTVDKAKNVGMAVTAQELIFNVDRFMDDIGKAAILELGSQIEQDIANLCVTAPYRFYGDGLTPINSFQQLAEGLAQFRTFGASRDDTVMYLNDLAIPTILNSGLNQFAPDRNNDIANTWEIANWQGVKFCSSNLLPRHIAGTEGQAQNQLTVVSVTKNADGGITSITFSGTTSATDPDCVKENDKFQFVDNVSGQPNVRFRHFIGHSVSSAPVQFRATADAAAAGSQVTVTIEPALQAASGKNQNLSTEIVAGMKVLPLPNHRAGMIQSGNQLYIAVPRLPSEAPAYSAEVTDPETGVSLRMYTGAGFGQNLHGTVYDCIWGKTQVSDNCMSLIFPDN